MNHPHCFLTPTRLSAVAVSLWAATAALAQATPEAPNPQKKPPIAQTAPAGFQSSLDSFKPYKDEKIGNWKEANERTGHIGGWRAYAKEAAQTEPDPHAEHAKPTPVQPTQAKP